MRNFPMAVGGMVAVTLMASPVTHAQKRDPNKITEQDKQTYQDFVAGMKQANEIRKNKARLLTAITNLRQIGLAMFEFETEYGEYPSEETAVMVKETTETKAHLKAATANDCFYQLIAAGIVQSPAIFSYETPQQQAAKKDVGELEKCEFSVLAVKSAAGNPSKPLVIAPLLKGKEIFDRVALGGKAVVLHLDNSVRSYPIEKDGRVLVNGMDLFDPAQPFWSGDMPEIRWPKD